ncbi:MAG: hypothetical protein L0287_35270 [Anaerolineae bacterium]|nr:hypothetical protein [Anaerolineae bacterium]
MFFQEPTPDTSGYMIAGYAIAFIVMSLYVLSLYLRSRNLNQDIAMLEEIDKSVVKPETSQPKPKKSVSKTVTKQGRKKQP